MSEAPTSAPAVSDAPASPAAPVAPDDSSPGAAMTESPSSPTATTTPPTVAPDVASGSTTEDPSSSVASPSTSIPTTNQPVASPTSIPLSIPSSRPTRSAPYSRTPVVSPDNSPSMMIPDPDRSMQPHEEGVATQIGNYEKEAVDTLTPAEIFGITCAVLVFVCILGFCFGRRCTLWCHKQRTSSRQLNSADESLPFSQDEKEML